MATKMGWIKLHRSILDHWLWDDPRKLQWWIDILLLVNHEDEKVCIGNNLIVCRRGETIRSLQTLAERWLVTKKTVKTFLELLKSDSMIDIENIKISTRITVCNYEQYQSSVNAKETAGKRKVNAEETAGKQLLPPNKNDKEFKEGEEYKENILLSADNFEKFPEQPTEKKPDKYSEFVLKFNTVRNSNFRYGDTKARRQYHERIKSGYTDDDILLALSNLMKEKRHIESNYQYLTPEFITRSDKIELGLNIKKLPPQPNPTCQ